MHNLVIYVASKDFTHEAKALFKLYHYTEVISYDSVNSQLSSNVM